MVATSKRSALALPVLVAVVACAPIGSTLPSSADPSPPDSAPGGIGLPSDCEPINLRDPDGQRVDLSGEWEGVDVLVAPEERVWLQQIGNCLYGSVIGVFRPPNDEPETFVVDLGGHLSSDFTLDLDVVFVYQDNVVFPFANYSTMVTIIEWDADGRIRLREDRESGERAGRCATTNLQCPPPVIWYRAGEAPAS